MIHHLLALPHWSKVTARNGGSQNGGSQKHGALLLYTSSACNTSHRVPPRQVTVGRSHRIVELTEVIPLRCVHLIIDVDSLVVDHDGLNVRPWVAELTVLTFVRNVSGEALPTSDALRQPLAVVAGAVVNNDLINKSGSVMLS